MQWPWRRCNRIGNNKKITKKIKNKNIEGLPLVGNGDVFNSIKSKNFRKIGFLKELPSGGFSNQTLK